MSEIRWKSNKMAVPPFQTKQFVASYQLLLNQSNWKHKITIVKLLFLPSNPTEGNIELYRAYITCSYFLSEPLWIISMFLLLLSMMIYAGNFDLALIIPYSSWSLILLIEITCKKMLSYVSWNSETIRVFEIRSSSIYSFPLCIFMLGSYYEPHWS